MTMATIDYSVCYLDGSGFPTTIRVGPLFFSFDYIGGKIDCREISGRSVLRRERLRCTSIAQQAYRRLVADLPRYWLDMHAGMYADLMQ